MTSTPKRLAAVIAVLLPSSMALAEPTMTAAGPASRPARPPAEIMAEMAAAKTRLAAAIGKAASLADPARRAAVAPAALPPLRTLLADNREFVAATGRPAATAAPFELQLRATMSALGDRESTDALARQAADPDVETSLGGQAGQLLARWVQTPGDAGGQSKVVDDLSALDGAHPGSDQLAYYTVLMSTSAASPAVHDRLVGLLGPMTSPTAVKLRNRFAATRP